MYEDAKGVLLWLGPDIEENQAVAAVNAMVTSSDFLCQKLSVSGYHLRSVGSNYQELVLKNHARLLLLGECDISACRFVHLKQAKPIIMLTYRL